MSNMLSTLWLMARGKPSLKTHLYAGNHDAMKGICQAQLDPDPRRLLLNGNRTSPEHCQRVCLMSSHSVEVTSRCMQHYEICKYYQSTSKCQPKVLQNLAACRPAGVYGSLPEGLSHELFGAGNGP